MSEEYLAPWDSDIILPFQCTLRRLYNGKGEKSLWLRFLHLFSPQEKEGVEAVSVGAILSEYQRIRVENVYVEETPTLIIQNTLSN